MKAGDLVEYVYTSPWGGRTPTGRVGVIIRRTYLAWDKKFSKWDVWMKGGVVSMAEKYLRRIELK